MPQAILNSARTAQSNWPSRLRVNARLIFTGARDLLALATMTGGLGLGFVVLAERVSLLAM